MELKLLIKLQESQKLYHKNNIKTNEETLRKKIYISRIKKKQVIDDLRLKED